MAYSSSLPSSNLLPASRLRNVRISCSTTWLYCVLNLAAISATLCCPSQRARRAEAVALSTSTPSGASRTCFWRTESHCRRARALSRGRALIVTSHILGLGCDRMLDGVQHTPQDVALELKCDQSSLLLLARAA